MLEAQSLLAKYASKMWSAKVAKGRTMLKLEHQGLLDNDIRSLMVCKDCQRQNHAEGRTPSSAVGNVGRMVDNGRGGCLNTDPFDASGRELK